MKDLSLQTRLFLPKLQRFTKTLFRQDIAVNVTAKAYDFGVLSFSFEIPVLPHTPLPTLEAEAVALDSDNSFDVKAKEYLGHLITGLEDTVIRPAAKETFLEDYTIFFIEELNKRIVVPEFLNRYDLARLLLHESRPLSPHLKEETLRNRFSYYPDDLVILHFENAFILEPSGNLDILNILDFASAQLRELRYYDTVLDKELSKIYSELHRRGRTSVFKFRAYERLARKISQTVSDISIVILLIME